MDMFLELFSMLHSYYYCVRIKRIRGHQARYSQQVTHTVYTEVLSVIPVVVNSDNDFNSSLSPYAHGVIFLSTLSVLVFVSEVPIDTILLFLTGVLCTDV